jgi:YVTN family beta-propeller protein
VAGAGPPASPAQTPVVAESPTASGVLGAVPAGRGAWSVAVSEPLRRAYVTNREDDTVTVVDLVANQVFATLPMGRDPHNVVVDEAANRVYVTLHGGAERGDAVAVLDAADGRLLATWPTGPFPAALALNPVAGRLYVQNEGDNTLTALDTRSGAEVARVSMPGILTDVAVSSGSGRVYAPNWIANTLVTLDGQSHSVVGQTPVGPMPWRVTVNPRTERVYVADGTSPGADQGSLYTVEGWDGTVQGRALGAVPLGVAVDPITQEVLVTDARLGTLSVLDETGQQVRWQGVIGPAPHTIVPVPGLGRAYVILSGQNALGVLEWPPRDRAAP